MLPDWKGALQKQECWRQPGRMADWSKAPDSRSSPGKNSGTRLCAWVRIPLLSEHVLNTMRQSLQLTNSVILERQFKMTVRSKRKQKNRNVNRGRQPTGLKVHKKEAEICEVRMYACVWTQILANWWQKPFSRLHLRIAKFIQLKGHRS